MAMKSRLVLNSKEGRLIKAKSLILRCWNNEPKYIWGLDLCALALDVFCTLTEKDTSENCT